MKRLAVFVTAILVIAVAVTLWIRRPGRPEADTSADSGPAPKAEEDHEQPFVSFRAAAEKAGLRCLAVAQSANARAELWRVFRRDDRIKTDWIVYSTAGPDVCGGGGSTSIGGELAHAGGSEQLIGFGMGGFIESGYKEIDIDEDTFLFTQTFKVPTRISGPLSFVFKVNLYFDDESEKPMEFRVANVQFVDRGP